jgi:hypothetical protein
MNRDYRTLQAANFEGIAAELPAASQVYAVQFADTRPEFPVVFENDRYRVMRVR